MRTGIYIFILFITLAPIRLYSQRTVSEKNPAISESLPFSKKHPLPDTIVYLNAIHLRAADLLQFCAGVTYERYIVSKHPMSLMFSFSYSFIPTFLLNYSPEYIIAAGYRYQFRQHSKHINFYVLPEVVYSERSLSLFHHYSSPAAYLSGGAQYRKNRLSFMASFGAGIAGDAISYSPSVRLQANLGYAF